MKAVVTGARGFVGLNLVKTLARRGVDVWAVDRGPRDRWVDLFLEDVSARIRHLNVDLSVEGQLAASDLPPELDAIIHAAVVTATTEEVERRDARDIIDSNVGGTIEALDLAASRSATRFVYISSPSAIGDADTDEPLNESVVPRPTTLYGITKLASEQIVNRWADLYEFKATSVRIAQPYGPGERATGSRLRTSPIWEWLQDATRGRTLPTGPLDRARDWTYVEDTAEGIVRVALAPDIPHRLYHLGVGSQSTVGAVINALSDAFGDLDVDLHPTPETLNPNISGPGRPHLDNRRFADDFEWTPETAIVDGMGRYIEWWNEYGKTVNRDRAEA